MPTQSKSPFFMDTAGRCFMCLKELRFSDTSILNRAASTMSFKLLSRHLQVDFRNVFCGGGVPSARHVGEVAVPLCLQCVPLSEKFLEEYRQLEVMKMRVNSRVREVEEVMRAANVKSENYFGTVRGFRMGTPVGPDVIQTTQNFRTEILAKCADKANQTYPRVNLQRTISQERQEEEERDVKLFNFDDTKTRQEDKPRPGTSIDIQTSQHNIAEQKKAIIKMEVDPTTLIPKCPEVRVVLERLTLPENSNKNKTDETQSRGRKRIRFSLPKADKPTTPPGETPKRSSRDSQLKQKRKQLRRRYSFPLKLEEEVTITDSNTDNGFISNKESSSLNESAAEDPLRTTTANTNNSNNVHGGLFQNWSNPFKSWVSALNPFATRKP